MRSSEERYHLLVILGSIQAQCV